MTEYSDSYDNSESNEAFNEFFNEGLENDFEYNPEFAGFIDTLKENLNNWLNKSKVRMIDPLKFNEFKKVFEKLVVLIQKDNPNAKITYKLNDSFDRGIATITAEYNFLRIKNVTDFIDIIKDANSIIIYALTTENTRMSIDFKNLYFAQYVET